jgi:hypothetical protein
VTGVLASTSWRSTPGGGIWGLVAGWIVGMAWGLIMLYNIDVVVVGACAVRAVADTDAPDHDCDDDGHHEVRRRGGRTVAESRRVRASGVMLPCMAPHSDDVLRSAKLVRDTTDPREGPNLHDTCLPLRALVGVWRGEGSVDYPTIDGPYRFVQEVTLSHDGRPFLHHETHSWLIDEKGSVPRAAARESGWWRPQPNGGVELLLAHCTGILELFYGSTTGATSWELSTDTVVPSASAKDVNAAERIYDITQDGSLNYVEKRAMVGQPLRRHVSAHLHRVTH